jgi:hypothetical protein
MRQNRRGGLTLKRNFCHNSHQWDSRDITSKAGANPEVDGDGNASFLRLPAVEQHGALCAECHN